MIHHAVLKGVSSCCRPGAGGEEQREVFESALKSVDATFQNLDSSEISLTDVSHYFDSDPTKLVSGLRTDGKLPSSYIADTTTANAQVCLLTLNHTVHGLLTLNHTVHGMVIANQGLHYCCPGVCMDSAPETLQMGRLQAPNMSRLQAI